LAGRVAGRRRGEERGARVSGKAASLENLRGIDAKVLATAGWLPINQAHREKVLGVFCG
jgi:hypothetical protein